MTNSNAANQKIKTKINSKTEIKNINKN